MGQVYGNNTDNAVNFVFFTFDNSHLFTADIFAFWAIQSSVHSICDHGSEQR